VLRERGFSMRAPFLQCDKHLDEKKKTPEAGVRNTGLGKGETYHPAAKRLAEIGGSDHALAYWQAPRFRKARRDRSLA
jgi:hypothetical protein